MRATDRLRISLVAAICAILVVTQGVGASDIVNNPHFPRNKGGTDGAGSLPKTVGPGSPTNPNGLQSFEVAAPTPGLVIDAISRQPIVGATVVVTDSLGQIVAVDITDPNGEFLVYLFDEPDLELAVPIEGVSGVQVFAGEAIVILVP